MMSAKLIGAEGRKAVLISGDLKDEAFCRTARGGRRASSSAG